MDAPQCHWLAIGKPAWRRRDKELVGGKLPPFKFAGLFAVVSTSTHRLIGMRESKSAYSRQA
jgi:hypothetical protein